MKKLDIIGKRFGRLVVIGEAEPHYTPKGRKTRRVECLCDCGVVKSIDVCALTKTAHSTVSCGCWKAEQVKARMYKHGDSHTRLHQIWRNMMYRCYAEGSPHYRDYGARGIAVTEPWHDYLGFKRWALANGYADELQIDRQDNNGDYSPENCHWTTLSVNSRNKRNTHLVTAWGETKVLNDWVKDGRCVVSARTLRGRMKNGWDAETAITTATNQWPTRPRNEKGQYL